LEKAKPKGLEAIRELADFAKKISGLEN